MVIIEGHWPELIGQWRSRISIPEGLAVRLSCKGKGEQMRDVTGTKKVKGTRKVNLRNWKRDVIRS